MHAAYRAAFGVWYALGMTDEAQPLLNPWFSIWTKPRATMRQILDTDPKRHVIVLGMAAAVATALDRASTKSLGDKYQLHLILGIPILLSPLTGLIYVYLYGALLRWTGKWIGGRGTAEGMRAAVAWPHVVTAWVLPLWVPQLLIYGRELFTTETPKIDANPFPLLGLFVLELVATAWFIVVFLKCVGEAQGFSAWRSLGNVVISLAVVGGVVLFIFLPIVLLSVLAK
jgi:hypothetical protein